MTAPPSHEHVLGAEVAVHDGRLEPPHARRPRARSSHRRSSAGGTWPVARRLVDLGQAAARGTRRRRTTAARRSRPSRRGSSCSAAIARPERRPTGPGPAASASMSQRRGRAPAGCTTARPPSGRCAKPAARGHRERAARPASTCSASSSSRAVSASSAAPAAGVDGARARPSPAPLGVDDDGDVVVAARLRGAADVVGVHPGDGGRRQGGERERRARHAPTVA